MSRKNTERRLKDAQILVLRQFIGKLTRLVLSPRPSLPLCRARLQQHIAKSTVKGVTTADRLVDPSCDTLEILTIGDASFVTVENAAPQASLVVSAIVPEIVDTSHASVPVRFWKSHRLRRRVRSTVTAESLAVCWAKEAAEVHRAHLAVLCNPGSDKLQILIRPPPQTKIIPSSCFFMRSGLAPVEQTWGGSRQARATTLCHFKQSPATWRKIQRAHETNHAELPT